jgi:hypothetical protein
MMTGAYGLTVSLNLLCLSVLLNISSSLCYSYVVFCTDTNTSFQSECTSEERKVMLHGNSKAYTRKIMHKIGTDFEARFYQDVTY